MEMFVIEVTGRHLDVIVWPGGKHLNEENEKLKLYDLKFKGTVSE